MKKYRLYQLYVVKIEGDNPYYLICKHHPFNNNYMEIFTNETITMKNHYSVEPFCNFFPSLSLCEITTLDKNELWRKYIEMNRQPETKENKVEQEEYNIIVVNEILKKTTLELFPTTGIWYHHCFRRPKELNMNNLPCHLRNDLWLARMLKKNSRLRDTSLEVILSFVKTSSFFQEKRAEYEQRIVTWQIEWMMGNHEGWIVDDNYGGDFVFLTGVCDLGFRKGIVDTLSRIGMDIEAIEEGIEKNADKWREAMMNRAFYNNYEPVFADFRGYLSGEKKPERKTLPPISMEHKEEWLKMRRYEYYQAHKESVDKYGTINPDMLLSKEEATALKFDLEQKHKERMKQIEQYKQEQYETEKIKVKTAQ